MSDWVGRPAQREILEEIAKITRGKLVEDGEIQKLIAEIAALPEPEPQVKRLRIWCHPAWVGSLVFLLGVFWVGRKMAGVI